MSRNTAPAAPSTQHQIHVLDIGKMCLVQCILLISIKKRGYGCHAFLTCILLLLLLIRCKISLYLGPVQCFVTPVVSVVTSVKLPRVPLDALGVRVRMAH